MLRKEPRCEECGERIAVPVGQLHENCGGVIKLAIAEWRPSEKMDWQEQFLLMKRWYYRLRGEHDFFGLNTSYQEDFYLAFFVICHHFGEWLIKDKVTTKDEVRKYIDQHDALKLCADVCTFSKHAEVVRNPRTGDPQTRAIGQRFMVQPLNGSSYVTSTLKIDSGGKTYFDAFGIVEECMSAWAEFLTEKSLEIPDMPEEHIFKYFKKWDPNLSR